MTDAGGEGILSAPWADRLGRLELIDNAFSAGMRDRLRARFGDAVLLDQSDDPGFGRLSSRTGGRA
jgi:hypothetical protein